MNTLTSLPFRYRLRSVIYRTPLSVIFTKLRKVLLPPPAHQDAVWWDDALKADMACCLGGDANIGLRDVLIGELLRQNEITPRRVLDMGCGGGTLCHSLTQCKLETYIGVDISGYAIERNISMATNGKDEHGIEISFAASSLQTYTPPPQTTFDVIAFNEVLYFLDVQEVSIQLKRFCRNLDHDGVMVVTMKDDPKSHAIFRKLTQEFDWMGGTLFQECGRRPHFRIKINPKAPGYVVGLLRPKRTSQS